MKLHNLALSISLLLASATGAIAQDIPSAQQKSPAGIEGFPYRPACSQLSAVPGGTAGWLAWGVTVDGTHQTWKGLKASTATDKVYQTLASLGLCVEGGAIVPLTMSQAQTIATENLTPMERNIAELKGEATDSGQGTEDSDDSGFGTFMGVVLLLVGGAYLMERFEDKPWAKKITGDSSKVFDNVPPSFSDTHIPDRISPDDLGDLPNSPNQPRSALEVIKGSPFISRAIFGAQRCGKTNLAAMALNSLAQEQGVKVFVMNLSAYDGNGEAGVYWSGEHFETVLCDLDEIVDAEEAQKHINRASALVDEFCTYEGAAILLVDEWASMTAAHATYSEQLQPLIKKLAGRITSLASSGMQRKKAVWTVAPEMVAETMDGFGKAVKKLSLCLVAIAPGHVEQWKGQEITFSDELFSQIKRNYSGVADAPTDSEHSRIAFVGGQWRDLGTTALVKVSVSGAGEVGGSEPVDTVPTHSALPRLTTTTDNVTGDLKLFLEWLQGKDGELIDYAKFCNASKFKQISRSRTVFDSLCDKSCMKGWLLAEGNDSYRVNL